jgi:asparagine synthase (glutamine-hydrolysing)
MTRAHVTVALSGDGGDELFGGYTRYGQMENARDLAPVPRRIAHSIAMSLPYAAYGRNKLIDLSRGWRGRYAATVAYALPVAEGGVLDVAPAKYSLDAVLGTWFDEAANRDPLTQMTLVDMMTYLPGDILTKVDRTSMRASLEARVPLLDHHLVEFAVSLPGHLKRRDGVGKWILREAIRGLVPDIVFNQPKRGFAVPLVRWMRNELRYRLERLREPGRPIYAYVHHESVDRLVSEHLRERRDHSHMLWRLLVLDLWLSNRMSSMGT